MRQEIVSWRSRAPRVTVTDFVLSRFLPASFVSYTTFQLLDGPIDPAKSKRRTRSIPNQHLKTLVQESRRRLSPLRHDDTTKVEESLPRMEDRDESIIAEIPFGQSSLEKNPILVRRDLVLPRSWSTREPSPLRSRRDEAH